MSAFKFTQKYEALLTMAQELKDKALAPLRAHETKKRLELALGEVDIQIAEASNKCNELTGAYPLDVDAVLENRNQIALLELKRQNILDTIAELF